jgi:hypothetical protein
MKSESREQWRSYQQRFRAWIYQDFKYPSSVSLREVKLENKPDG